MTKKELNITNIDNTAPEIKIGEFDEENKIIKGEITDEESGVVAYAVTKTISKPTSWIIIENNKKFDKLNYQITKKELTIFGLKMLLVIRQEVKQLT